MGTSEEEPGAHQYKYYAVGVGNISVGFGGADETEETLELVKFEQLDAAGLAQLRQEALKLEENAYQTSPNVYPHTQPSE